MKLSYSLAAAALLLSAGFAVLDARNRGRQVQVADLLSEPGDLNDELLKQLVEQGSADTPAPKASRSRPN